MIANFETEVKKPDPAVTARFYFDLPDDEIDPLVSAEYDGEDEPTELDNPYFQPGFLGVRPVQLAGWDS